MARPTFQDSELLLVATEQQVFAYNLSRRRRVTAGRHASNDLRLDSQTVSNFHAELVRDERGVVVRDLGSTNGTFVNDELIEVKHVRDGDRLRIGNHSMILQIQPLKAREELERPDAGTNGLVAGRRGSVISFEGRSAAAHMTVPGVDPNDFTLPDLLKRGAESPAPLCVLVRREDEEASVWFRERGIVHARLGTVLGDKALYRLLTWREGSYEVRPADAEEPERRTISLPLEALLREGMEHAIELERLIESLPALDAPLRMKEDYPLSITSNTPAEIEVFQLVVRHETIASVLEASPFVDVRVLRLIDALLAKGVIEPATETMSSGTLMSRRTTV